MPRTLTEHLIRIQDELAGIAEDYAEYTHRHGSPAILVALTTSLKTAVESVHDAIEKAQGR